MLVFLDNCVFNRAFDDQSQTRIRKETEAIVAIRDRIVEGDVELVWSYVIDIEVFRNPFLERRLDAESWKELSIVDIGPSVEIVSNAIRFQGLGFREIDSLHIACAVASKSSYFISTDDGILKKSGLIGDLVLAGPIEFAEIVT